MSDSTLFLIVFFVLLIVDIFLSRWRAKKGRKMLDAERWSMVQIKARSTADYVYLAFVTLLFLGNSKFNMKTLSLTWDDMGVFFMCILVAHEIVECVALLIYDKKFKIIF